MLQQWLLLLLLLLPLLLPLLPLQRQWMLSRLLSQLPRLPPQLSPTSRFTWGSASINKQLKLQRVKNTRLQSTTLRP